MAHDAVVMPDVTVEVCDYLRSNLVAPLNGTHVGSAVPNPRPATFVAVERIGGPRRDAVIDDALMIVEAWAETEATAWDLAEQCRALLGAWPWHVDAGPVRRVREAAGPGRLPDPDSANERVTFTVEVTVRGEVLS